MDRAATGPWKDILAEVRHIEQHFGDDTAYRMTPLLIAAYALAIPIVLGLISGINESGSARMVSKEAYIVRYVVRSLLSWWVTILATYVLAVALRPWKPSFLVLMVCGPVITVILNAPLSLIWQPLFTSYLAEGSQFYPLWPWRFDDTTYLKEGLLALLTNEIIWVSFNITFWRAFDVRLYGFPPPAARGRKTVPADSAEHVPLSDPSLHAAFLDRLPKEIGINIIALEAQEHYTKVHTPLGSALILYRFGDAVKDMTGQGGLQVHRSHWVQTHAIQQVDRSGRTYELTLTTGIKIPVSRSYKVKIDELGLA